MEKITSKQVASDSFQIPADPIGVDEKPYTITIYLKQVPPGEDENQWCKNEKTFLKYLLQPENVRVEIMKGDRILSEVNKKLNEGKYEDQRLFFSFIAYMTSRKKSPVSPTKLEKLKDKDEKDILKDEKPLYIFTKEVGGLTRARYSQWIKDIRAFFSEEELKTLLPIDRGGYEIKGLIRFKKEKV